MNKKSRELLNGLQKSYYLWKSPQSREIVKDKMAENRGGNGY